MKKQKALDDMTHQDLFEALIYDENIQDNMHVSNDYELDEYGNNLITIGFEGVDRPKQKGTNAMVLLTFNKKGRLVTIEVATMIRGQHKWQVAVSERFVDMKPRFSVKSLDKKAGN